jgi:hypothetical protein
VPDYGDISGIKPPPTADNTYSIIGEKRLTYIDQDGAYIGILTANQINAIQGIVLGSNATIQWASLSSYPTAEQVGARPYDWVPTADDVNARPDTWIPDYGTEVGGVKPPTNADNTYSAIGSNRLTYIDGSGIYTGTLTANQINAIVGINLGYGASINWSYVGKPSYSASEVGAKPDNWSPSIYDVSGLSGRLTYIDQYGGYFGYLSADKISGGTISGVTISVDTNLKVGNSIQMGSDSYSTKMIYFNNGAYISTPANSSEFEMYSSDGMRIYGKVGFMGNTPIGQQSAQRLAAGATLEQIRVKLNGIMDKLALFGLFYTFD